MAYNPKVNLDKKVDLCIKIAQLKGIKEHDIATHIRLYGLMNLSIHVLKQKIKELTHV